MSENDKQAEPVGLCGHESCDCRGYCQKLQANPAEPVLPAGAQEPVATKLETQQFNCFHVSAEDFERLKALPVGAKLYTAPPAAAINE